MGVVFRWEDYRSFIYFFTLFSKFSSKYELLIHWNISLVKIIGRIKYISEKEKKLVLLLSACIFYHKIKKKSSYVI